MIETTINPTVCFCTILCRALQTRKMLRLALLACVAALGKLRQVHHSMASPLTCTPFAAAAQPVPLPNTQDGFVVGSLAAQVCILLGARAW